MALGALAIVVLALSGCAYSDSQPLEIQTALPGAVCDLSNDKGTWRVVTPARVRVREGAEPMRVNCQRAGKEVSFEIPAKAPSSWKKLMFGTPMYADKEMVVKGEPKE